jgi:hypothetical protein
MTYTKIHSMLTAAMVICLAIAVPAFGASAAARVDIPFAFEAANHSLPAGEYHIERNSTGSGIYLANAKGEKWAILTSPAGNPNRFEAPRVVFERSGSTYRMATMYFAGTSGAAAIPATKSQMTIARTTTPERIELALFRP